MTVVAVPYLPDRGHRDRLFSHLTINYWTKIGFPMSTGSSELPFNRSKAVNQALAGDWDYAVIADADTWVPEKQLSQALIMARATGKLVAAFDTVVELNRDSTQQILRKKIGPDDTLGCERIRRRPLETQSSMLVIPRSLWERVGGMDEQFQGWGCEDNAFWISCRLHGGEPERITGNAFHLWHPPAAGKFKGPEYRTNLLRLRQYQRATTVDELP